MSKVENFLIDLGEKAGMKSPQVVDFIKALVADLVSTHGDRLEQEIIKNPNCISESIARISSKNALH